jgi:DNA primase
MSGIDYRQLRQQVSMAQVLDLLRFKATSRRGTQLRGPCPIPGCPSASRRSFSVNLTRQVYRCFACGSHGNPLDLWAAARHLPLHVAALDLSQAVNLIPPRLPVDPPIPAPPPSRPVATHAPSRNRSSGPR